MKIAGQIRFAFLAAAVACGTVAVGQKVPRKAPTAEDWSSIAKLPDFTGVWEIGLAGGGGGRAAQAAKGPAPAGRAGGGRAAGPSLTPAYAEKAKAQPAAAPAEESLTANCLPPGMPGIMGQPYP